MVENAGLPLSSSACPPTPTGPTGLEIHTASIMSCHLPPPGLDGHKMEAANPNEGGSTTQELDLVQFRQWLMEHQPQLVQEVMGNREWSQVSLVHKFSKA